MIPRDFNNSMILPVGSAVIVTALGMDTLTAFVSDLVCYPFDRRKYNQHRDPAYQAAELAYYQQHYTPLSAFLEQEDQESEYALAASENQSAAGKLAERVRIVEAQIDDAELEPPIESENLAVLMNAVAKP